MSHSPIVLNMLHARVHCRELLFWILIFWLLLHHKYWALTGALIRYPVYILSHEDPVTLCLQDQSIHKLQQVTDGGKDGMCQLLALVLCLGSCWVSQAECFLTHPL